MLEQTPTVVMEGRAPLPNQAVTRQSYLSKLLQAAGVRTVFVEAQDHRVYNGAGCIHIATPYGATQPASVALQPGTYAWRLRDVWWPNGDKTAYQPSHGYNSQRARTGLAGRDGFVAALDELSLGKYAVQSVEPGSVDSDEMIFVKPRLVNDIGRTEGTRAKRLRAGIVTQKIMQGFAGGAILQRQEPLLPAMDLADQLGVRSPLDQSYLHAIRVFSPLWLSVAETPAIELRFTNPQKGIGEPFATHLHLLEPQAVWGNLRQLARAHKAVHAAFIRHYGRHNYLAFDYLIRNDGSVRVLNGLVRALTPNLEGQPQKVRHLARATADVEAEYLIRLARRRQAT